MAVNHVLKMDLDKEAPYLVATFGIQVLVKIPAILAEAGIVLDQ